jgi:hypothetical protein
MTTQASASHRHTKASNGSTRLSGRVAALLVVGVLALAGVVYLAWPTTMQHREMHSSYAYDVSNLRLLSGQADAIIFARVVEIVAVNEKAGTTAFAVEVTDAIKGDLSGRLTVEQLGFIETSGKTHVTVEDPDQPLLRPASDVLLTLGQEPDGRYVVIGGPRSVVVLGESNQRSAVRAERAAAARNAQPVRDGSGRVVLPVKQRPVH